MRLAVDNLQYEQLRIFLVQEVLSINKLGKSCAGRRIVRDVSFQLAPGQVVGLLGPNGAGKTTTFYMVMGLVKSDQGSIHLGEIDITNLPVYRRALLGLGYLPQESSVFRGLNVGDNIKAVLELYEDNRDSVEAKLEDLLAKFSISYLRSANVMSLSGGERRRVEIARCLAADPKFILLDEPLAGIDPIAVTEISNLISYMKSCGIGVLITDHNVREALNVIDYAYIIHEGVVISSGTPQDVVDDERVRKVYLGESFYF